MLPSSFVINVLRVLLIIAELFTDITSYMRSAHES